MHRSRARADVPLVVSYDRNERVFNPPMPAVPAAVRLENRAVGETSLPGYLAHALTAIGAKDTTGRPLRYTFHDFRRISITEAILLGITPHVASWSPGTTTSTHHGYQAVYPEEAINGRRDITRRRALRQAAEYRVPADAEWAGFTGHFERAKSPSATAAVPTNPLHPRAACLRCPLLRPAPPSIPASRGSTTT